MGRKALQDIANSLPQMVVGWRMFEDLEKLADMPNARVTIDVLRATARRDEAESLDLRIAAELATWFADRLAVEKIPTELVSAAILRLDVRSDRIPTDRDRIILFDFECHCVVTTAERVYEGFLKEKHRWHQRVGV